MPINHGYVQVAADGTGKKIGNIQETDGDSVEVYVQKTTTWDPEDGTDTGGWKIDSNAGRTGSVDGGHATIGTTTDTEASSGNGTLIALLKRLRTLLGGGLPAALGAGGGVKVDGSGTALPVSLASAPSTAVTNAGTFAVQASEVDGANVTLGAKADAKSTATDTTAITAMSVWKQISASVQAIASSVAGTLTVATHAVTQSGAWSVTANAGTNLNTSALATSAKQDAEAVLVGAVDETAPATDTASSGLGGRLQRIAQRLTSIIALLPTALGAGGGLKVDGSGTALPVSGTVTVGSAPADPFGANADAVITAGAAGSISAKLRAISRDLVQNIVLAAGSAIIGKVGIDQTTPGTTNLVAAGQNGTWTVQPGNTANTTAWKVDGSAVTQPVSGTFWQATQPVSGTVTTVDAGDVASDGVDAGNPVKMGAQARTSDATAVSSADRVNAIATILGKLIVKLDAVPDLTWNYAAVAGGLVTTGGVTAKAAGAGGVRNYVKSCQVINSHATISTEVVIRDGASGTVLHRGWAQANGGGYAMVFDPPLRGTAATLIEVAEVTTTGTTGVLVSLQGYQAAE